MSMLIIYALNIIGGKNLGGNLDYVIQQTWI